MIKSHLTEVREMMEAAEAPNLSSPELDIEWNSTVGRLEPELDRCVWCCPTTCANCSIEHCSDRLAGGEK